MRLTLLIAVSLLGVASAIPQKLSPRDEAPATSSEWPSNWKQGDQIPASMALKNIPAGVDISSIDGNDDEDDSLTSRADAGPRGLATLFGLAKRSNCNGSSSCAGYVTAGVCWSAYQRYEANTYYCKYTSRVAFHDIYSCTSIYQCNQYKDCMAGWWLREQFDNIYNKVGCKRCGTYDIPDGDGGNGCRVTANYCSSCSEVG